MKKTFNLIVSLGIKLLNNVRMNVTYIGVS